MPGVTEEQITAAKQMSAIEFCGVTVPDNW